MNYLLVEDGIIINSVILSEQEAKELKAVPFYKGACVGAIYSPPSIEKDLLDAVIEQGIKLKKLEMGLNNNVV